MRGTSGRVAAMLCGAALVAGLVQVGGSGVLGASEPSPASPTPAEIRDPSPGCGASHVAPGLHRDAMVVDGLDRSWVVQVPTAHDGLTPLPLVIELHGYGNDVADQMATSGFGALGDQQGFVVVAPIGRGDPARWLFELDTASLDVTRANPDIAFVAALIDRLQLDLCLDRSRVFVTGLSNGAWMASAVGCALADRVAAVAAVAGVVDFGDACRPARPVPMLAFHGTADPLLPFEGGFGTDLLALLPTELGIPFGELPMVGDPMWSIPVAQRVAGIAMRNGCAPTPAVDAFRMAADRSAWDCPPGAEVELIGVWGGSHDWPRGNIDATALIWSFFRAHPLPLGSARSVDAVLAARLSAVLETAVTDAGVPGAQVAVVLADGSTWTAGEGSSAPGQPMTPDLLMAIASLTKLDTAALTLDLALDGLLSLDDPLDRWVPEAPHGKGVTIRQLLSHTSGIASDDPALDPVCDPGSCVSYSNAGYRSLGQVIERASGDTYAAVLRRRILQPLGLASTFSPRQEPVVGDVATGYGPDGEVLATDAAAPDDGPGWFAASGGLVATAADTARFAHALFTGAVLPATTLGTMLDFDGARGLPGGDDCKGAGMNVWRHSGDLGESWYAGGNAGAFRSWVEHYPAQGVTIVAITNSDVPATGIVDALAHAAIVAAPPAVSGRCNTDIAVRSADGTVRLVTTDPAVDGSPSWSPDGSRLVWSGLRDGQQDVWIAEVDGAGAVRLTDDAPHDLFPRWSPDGTAIAFSSDRDGDFEIFLMAPDGGDVRQLTHDDWDEWVPAWSPDGSRIAYISTDGGQHVRVMDADGSGDRPVTSGVAKEWWPTWSPDGRRIAYESAGVISIVPVEGGDPVRLPIPQVRVTQFPSWAPGREIVFASDGDLYATDEAGTTLRRLTATSTTEELPAWSPDGTSIAFQLSHWESPGERDPS